MYLADDQEQKADDTEANEYAPKGGIKGVMFHVELSNEERLDSVWKKAVDKSASSKVDLAVQFWGDKYGVQVDPFGHQWSVSIPSQDGAPPDKMKKTEE